MFTIVQLMILVAAVIGSGGAAAIVAWLFFRTHSLGRQDPALDGRVSELQREIEGLRSDVVRLQEQADFNERLLSAGSAAEYPK